MERKKDDDDMHERRDEHDGVDELSESIESDSGASDFENADRNHIDSRIDIVPRKRAIGDKITRPSESEGGGDKTSWGSNTPMVRSMECESGPDSISDATQRENRESTSWGSNTPMVRSNESEMGAV